MVSRRPDPDPVEGGLRLGCGAVFGLFLFGPVAYHLGLRWKVPALALVGLAVAVLACAWAAYRQGDRFYELWAEGELAGEHFSRWTLWALVAAFLAFLLWLAWTTR